jgi:hypothetical protein
MSKFLAGWTSFIIISFFYNLNFGIFGNIQMVEKPETLCDVS